MPGGGARVQNLVLVHNIEFLKFCFLEVYILTTICHKALILDHRYPVGLGGGGGGGGGGGARGQNLVFLHTLFF